MPFARNEWIAAFLNVWVRNTVAGMPRFSNSTASCTLHNVQEPHPPTAAAATCTLFAIASISSGEAGLENASLRSMMTSLTP